MSRAAKAPREHLNIVDPDAGKRYKLHVRGAVYKLTVGKVKHCLAVASSCPIEESAMLLKLNGVPLHNDRDVCAALGIHSGATLTVEENTMGYGAASSSRGSGRAAGTDWERSAGRRARHGGVGGELLLHSRDAGSEDDRRDGVDDAEDAQDSDPYEESDAADERAVRDALYLGSLACPQRRMLETQTLDEQEHFIKHDSRAREDVFRGSLARVEDEIDVASATRRRLERQRSAADAALTATRDREQAARRERERLAELQAAEAARAAERAADLASRRAQLREEQEEIRRVAHLKLQNEKRREALESQRLRHEEERRRARLAQRSLESEDKERQLEIRAREIDMEHARLAYVRGQRELAREKEEMLAQRAQLYDQLGVGPVPLELLEDVAPSVSSSTRRTGPAGTGAESRAPSARPHGASSSTTVSPSAPAHAEARFAGSGSVARRPGEVASVRRATPEVVVPTVPDGCYFDAEENAAENLRRLGNDLGLTEPLAFDEASTCVISIDGEYTLLITYDAATERLFLHSTLLASIPGGAASASASGAAPQANAFRLRLYEFLLEGSLLGREMCGGGISASLKNDFVLMSTSLYLPTSQPWALRTVAPQFVQCLQHWRERLAEFIDAYASSHAAPAHAVRDPSLLLSREDFLAPPQTSQQRSGGGSSGSVRVDAAAAGAAALPYTGPPPRGPLANAYLQGLRRSASQPFSSASMEQHQQQPPSLRETPVVGLEITDSGVADGVLVVNAAGPAVLAGVQPHDVLVAVDGAPVRSAAQVHSLIRSLAVGQVVGLQIVRGGVPMVLRLQVGAAWVPA